MPVPIDEAFRGAAPAGYPALGEANRLLGAGRIEPTVRAILVSESAPPRRWRRGVADPHPGPGEVVADVHAIGVNYPDLLVIGGKYQILPPRPFIPGKAAAGVVAAVGEGVSLAGGARPVPPMPSRSGRRADAYPLPEGMSFAEAAAMGLAAQTAHFALVERGRSVAGETVLVTGAGGAVGLAAVQLAKALGAIALPAPPAGPGGCVRAAADHR